MVRTDWKILISITLVRCYFIFMYQFKCLKENGCIRRRFGRNAGIKKDWRIINDSYAYLNALRNESNIFFSWSRYQPKKYGKLQQCACCKSFPFFFQLIHRSTEKKIRFIYLNKIIVTVYLLASVGRGVQQIMSCGLPFSSCKSFPFFFQFIHRSTEIILDLFI